MRLFDVVRVDADHNGTARFTGDFCAAGDELTGGRRVQSHVSLSSIHGISDAKAPGVDIPSEGESGIPIDVGRSARGVVGMHLRNDVSRRVCHSASQCGSWTCVCGGVVQRDACERTIG